MRTLVICAIAMGLVPSSPGGGGPCDLKEVVSAFHCKTDSALYQQADLVSKKVYYKCRECGELDTEAGECLDCEKPRVKHTSGDNVCPACYQQPAKVKACKKTYYECPGCESTSTQPKACEECEETYAKKSSLALVEYRCTTCGHKSLESGMCPDKTCQQAKRKLTGTCSMSGSFPHETVKRSQ